jgi:hypothetical protein
MSRELIEIAVFSLTHIPLSKLERLFDDDFRTLVQSYAWLHISDARCANVSSDAQKSNA